MTVKTNFSIIKFSYIKNITIKNKDDQSAKIYFYLVSDSEITFI